MLGVVPVTGCAYYCPVSQARPPLEQALGEKILRDVSRSFYLSLRLLPADMRPVAGLGYLLARSTDTIADTEGLPGKVRQDHLERLRDCILERGQEAPGPLAVEIQEDFLPTVAHEGERRLLEKLGDCLQWLQSMDRPQRNALNTVMEAITEGQLADLERFGDANETHLAFLQSPDQLMHYADCVAGSVGRFWTQIAHLADPEFATESQRAMAALGERYGRGLQWLNILRDLGEDLRMGRCYLPWEELQAAGWRQDAGWQGNQTAILQVAEGWLKRIESALWDGVHYSENIRSRRLKLASVLPALIGASTLRALHKSQGGYLARRVKVKRRDVQTMVGKAAVLVWLNRPLDPYFRTLLYG